MTHFQLATLVTDRGPRAAMLIDGGLHDVADATGEPAYSTVLGILAEWDSALSAMLEAAGRETSAGTPLTDASLLAPVLYPSAIYCAGANYQDHMDAVAKHRGLPPQPSPRDVGVGPFFFLKSPRSIVDPVAEIVNQSEALDFEIELAVVIGRTARHVAAANALEYVAGYTIANDMSARDRIMRPQLPESSPFRFDWGSHKNFDGSCPLGPWIVPARSLGDPQALAMKTWVNGELRQDSSSAKMVFSIAEQIEALSRYNTLYPGDIILTGTPAGVGAETSRWIGRGDVVRMAIEGIGEITTTIR